MGKSFKTVDNSSRRTRKRNGDCENDSQASNTDVNRDLRPQQTRKQVKKEEVKTTIANKLRKKVDNNKETGRSENDGNIDSQGMKGSDDRRHIAGTVREKIKPENICVQKSGQSKPWTNVTGQFGHSSVNLTHYLNNRSLGLASPRKLRQSVSSPLVSVLSDLQLYRIGSPFDRRATAMEWHPTNPNIVAVGSKGGDIILWKFESADQDIFLKGMGPGGSVQALKFWPGNDKLLLTASIDGRVVLQDVEGRKNIVLADTMNCMDFWYCSVDVNKGNKTVLTGDNIGNTLLLSPEGKKLWSHRLHKSKVTHVEWSPREDWLFCTASCDQTVKLWDVRMVKGRDSSLCSLKHTKPINSAYFSLTDGCRLLTTDQNKEIRIYQSPSWTLERTIQHPHRFFQHITPFKAHWHPLQDLVVVGRYPDNNFKENDARTIDVYDAPSGGLVCQLQDQSAAGLVSLNKFSPRGDCLASGMGVSILIWSRREDVLKKQENLLAELRRKGITGDSGLAGAGSRRGQGQNRARSQQTKQTKTKTTEKNTKADTTQLKTKFSKR